MGKERGYLLYDEVNDILPAEVHSSEEIDDLLSTFERYGIDIYEDAAATKAGRTTVEPTEPGGRELKVESRSDGGDLELTRSLMGKNNTPVRLDLVEMAKVRRLRR